MGNATNTPIGYKTLLMEDLLTGADLGQPGAFSWHDSVPEELLASFDKAMVSGNYNSDQGGCDYWDLKTTSGGAGIPWTLS